MDFLKKVIQWVDTLFNLFGPFAGWFVLALLAVSVSKLGKILSLKVKVG